MLDVILKHSQKLLTIAFMVKSQIDFVYNEETMLRSKQHFHDVLRLSFKDKVFEIFNNQLIRSLHAFFDHIRGKLMDGILSEVFLNLDH